MTPFTHEELVIISELPLNDHLSDVQQSLRSHFPQPSTADADAPSAQEHSTDLPEADQQKAVARLILALLTHPVSMEIPSRILSEGVVARGLASVFLDLLSKECNLQPFFPLVSLITQEGQKTDLDIWRAVLDLLSSLSASKTTTFTSITNVQSASDTMSRSFTSASEPASEQTRELVEAALRHELRDCCFADVDGLLSKYFENKDWSSISDKIIIMVGTDLELSATATETEVWSWIRAFQARYLQNEQVQSRYYTTRSKASLLLYPLVLIDKYQ